MANYIVFLETRFVPFKSLHHETLSEENKVEIERTLTRTINTDGKPKELMPLPSNKYSYLKARTLKLEESINLQKIQADKLKEIQFKQAADRLASCATNDKTSNLLLSESKKMAYRETRLNGNSMEESEVEEKSEYFKDEDVNDDSESEDGVRVNFTQEELDPS